MSKRRIKDDVNQVSLTAYLDPVQKVEVMPNKTSQIAGDSNPTGKLIHTKTHVDNHIVTTDNTQDETTKKRKHASPEETQPPKRSNTQETPPYSMAELKQMEERLHTSLTSSLTTSLTQNLREELNGIVNDSIKGAVDMLNRAASRLDDCSVSIQKHDNEIKGLREKNDQLMQKVTVLETKQGLLKSKLNAIERKTLECCLVFKGIPDSDWEKEPVTKQKLYQELSRMVDGETEKDCITGATSMIIKQCKRLGRYQETKARAISVEFQLKQDVNYILENKKSLNNGIFIDREYSDEVEQSRKALRLVLKAAREHKDFKKKCKLEGDRLVIHGKKFTLDNLHNLPKELDVFKITSKSNNNTIGFFGELNPLSNFHPCKFEINGIQFHSSEQFIQNTKSMFFNDMETLAKILASKTALECKNLSCNIKGMEEQKWDDHAKSLCQKGIAEKFCQNPRLMDALASTGNKVLVESANNRLWGTGVPLHKAGCLESTLWSGNGILGEILSEI